MVSTYVLMPGVFGRNDIVPQSHSTAQHCLELSCTIRICDFEFERIYTTPHDHGAVPRLFTTRSYI